MKIKLTLALCLSLASRPLVGAPVDYVREVKPLLTEHCYRCHGASQQKSGLRLDTAAFAAKGGENGPAFAAGKPAESLMVQLLKGTHTRFLLRSAVATVTMLCQQRLHFAHVIH